MTAADKGDELSALVIEEIDAMATVAGQQVAFSRVLNALKSHRLYREPDAVVKQVTPMNDVQAKAFEQCLMPFGQFKGKLVKSCPLSYLCRLVDPSPFLEDLKCYLRSDRVKRELPEENEP